MQTLCKIRLAAALLVIVALPSTASAGVNKDMVQLQTQIQQLQDAVARLQQSNDERMGVLKDLVQQSADSVNRMSVSIDTVQKQLTAQQAAAGAKSDQLSGQIQSLNDSLDEVKARMARLEKTLADVQNLTQSMSSTIQNLPQGQPATGLPPTVAPTAPAAAVPPPTSTVSNYAPGTPLTAIAGGSPNPPAAGAPSATDLYRAAYNDYVAAKYPVAASEFSDLVKAYPDNQLAGNGFYYLGEIEYRNGKYAAAAKDYDRVLEQFPDSNKVPAAHLHKGQALVEQKQTEAAIREFRALIQRFPNSPEAGSARSKLNAMGVPIKPRT